MRDRSGLPNIPPEINSIFMQRMLRLIRKWKGDDGKGEKAVTGNDLVKLGLISKEELDKL